MNIKQMIKLNADALGIEPPNVKTVERLGTPSTIAAAATDGSHIAVVKDINVLTETFVFFAISHEMRHIWQIRSGFNLTDYAESADTDITAYNSQPAEVDAHAWAIIAVSSVYGIRPTLEHNLGADIWKLIQKRINEITEEK